MIINSGGKTQRITKDTIEVLPMSVHEETNKRLIIHARISNEAVGIFGKNVDVFLLLIYALIQLECFLPPWYMKINSKTFVNINIICNNLQSKISESPPPPPS